MIVWLYLQGQALQVEIALPIPCSPLQSTSPRGDYLTLKTEALSSSETSGTTHYTVSHPRRLES